MARTPQWHGVGVTHAGLVRPTNQDAFLVSDELGLWIVADGMGGHAGGDVASQQTVNAIHDYIAERASQERPAGTEEVPALLQSAIGHANKTVRAYAAAHPEFTGMGTTVVLVYLPAPSSPLAWVAHAGDSRAYLIRDQQLSALTRDHTVLEERIQEGLLPQSTPASHPDGHVLTRGVGVSTTVDADVSMINLQPMDEVLMCSDGLTKMLNDKEILDGVRTAGTQSLEQRCRALIDQANVRGGWDNTTVVLIARSW
ncbi:MAG: protein phosphatase 2C domain-containing protein [Nitrospira sp.]|nr:protein phosphatase 2C domain-containing protein [Nitrospira sp.]